MGSFLNILRFLLPLSRSFPNHKELTRVRDKKGQSTREASVLPDWWLGALPYCGGALDSMIYFPRDQSNPKHQQCNTKYHTQLFYKNIIVVSIQAYSFCKPTEEKIHPPSSSHQQMELFYFPVFSVSSHLSIYELFSFYWL